MHLPLLHWRLLAALPLVTAVAGQTCYWPNGVEATQAAACPVAGGTEVAACCPQNHYCMSNGLCFSQTELSFYRGACTDQNWTQSGCPKYCDKEEMIGGVPGRQCGVALCGDKKVACQTSGNCANFTFGVPAGKMLLNEYLKSDIGGLAETAAVATATVGHGTGTASAAATCSATAAEPSISSGISTGAAAGIGVGIGAPLALAIVALTVMLLREKRKTRAALSSQVDSSGTGPSSPWAKSERTAYVPVEIHGQPVPNELSSNHDRRHELS
ncbi:hypothetical protein BDP81DRAFT_489490 [Colletotrichum phormii]|uniref:Uncharacterized protein n=1 Tax=Colletotrichum phormii TaxID=359342 RepID=A0AAI9ZR17_9PEZI|nr:uncharacterized protein BDP81DRAFT_489490 [Colletotrichum phormii]KAK1636270.1 hypothetical protein BDP81DRAFT_489490 [Colletotrichum phormii]